MSKQIDTKKQLFLSITLGNIIFFGYATVQSFADIPVVISLGENCFTSIVLRHYKVRKEAYPFDWMVTPFLGLYKTLNTDFKHMLVKDALILDPFSSLFVLDKVTGLKFAHDFPSKHESAIHYFNQEADIEVHPGSIAPHFKEVFDSVKKKYDRRILRLQEQLNASARVILLRQSAGQAYNKQVNNIPLVNCKLSFKQQAIMLRNMVRKKYPKLRFLLVWVGNYPEMLERWNIEGIENFYVPPEDFSWNPEGAYFLAWKDILKKLHILN